jgi:hypothetical protein
MKCTMPPKSLLLYLIMAAQPLSAQRILPQVWFNENNISDNSLSIGDNARLYSLGSSTQELKGDYFWNIDFKKSKVYFYPQNIIVSHGKSINLDSLTGVDVRIDLANDNVEFKSGEEIKVISASKVSNILMLNADENVSQYINPIEFKAAEIKGLFELLAFQKGKTFLQSQEVLIQRANYNAALDTGNKEPTIAKKSHFYFWNTTILIPIDNKKDVAELLNSLNIDAKKYFKNSGNRLKDQNDYKKLAHFVFETGL